MSVRSCQVLDMRNLAHNVDIRLRLLNLSRNYNNLEDKDIVRVFVFQEDSKSRQDKL